MKNIENLNEGQIEENQNTQFAEESPSDFLNADLDNDPVDNVIEQPKYSNRYQELIDSLRELENTGRVKISVTKDHKRYGVADYQAALRKQVVYEIVHDFSDYLIIEDSRKEVEQRTPPKPKKRINLLIMGIDNIGSIYDKIEIAKEMLKTIDDEPAEEEYVQLRNSEKILDVMLGWFGDDYKNFI